MENHTRVTGKIPDDKTLRPTTETTSTDHNRILNSIPLKYRERYSYLLKKNFSVTVGHNILLYTQKMDETEFKMYVEQVQLEMLSYM